MKKIVCANCENEIQGEHYKIGDNFLQIKYFEEEDHNIFCSESCICRALSVLMIDSDGECYPYL